MPTPGIQVEGRCYWCCKVAALNGHRSKLSAERLTFVGFESDEPDTGAAPDPQWIPAARRHERIDRQLEELERLEDLAPNWFALARALVKDEKEES
jgi:hypothetical protein